MSGTGSARVEHESRRMSANTLNLVRTAVDELEEHGIAPVLGGGWAEELRRMIVPREHKDIDLFLVAHDLSSVDDLLTASGHPEIEAARPATRS